MGKDLDISADRAQSSFNSCIGQAKANGTDVHELERLVHTLGSSDGIVFEENWRTTPATPSPLEATP